MGEQPDQFAARPGREQAVSERAYAMWHDQRQPEGKDREHRLRAEREYDDDSGSASALDRMPCAEAGTKQ